MIKLAEDFKNIENDFFELDHENKKAHMKLSFSKPSDIFDVNSITKLPVLSDDFNDWIKASFEYAPRKYKIDLDIGFDDMEGYEEEQLKEIFHKNMLLEGKKNLKQTALKNKIALGLVITGLISLIAMILLLSLWKDGDVAKEIVSYVFDIATTVTFWEAMTILIVENKEKRDLTKNFIRKYDSITFHKNAGPEKL